jgi:hypothetical protein
LLLSYRLLFKIKLGVLTDFIYSLLGFVEVLFVELKADKVPLLHDGGYGGGAAADGSIQNYPPPNWCK